MVGKTKMKVLNVALTLGVVLLMLNMVNIFTEFSSILLIIIFLCVIQFAKYGLQLSVNVSDTLQDNTIVKTLYYLSIVSLVVGIVSVFFFKFWIVILFPLTTLLLVVSLILSFVLEELSEEEKDKSMLDI